nr:MAG TPA: hypothetical protein [Caudoviricetes sp.]
MSGRVKNDDKNFLSLVNITKMTLNINKYQQTPCFSTSL